MRLPRNPSRPIVTRHRGSPRLNREQPRQNSPRPLIVSSLSAFTERPAPPYQPPRTMIYVAERRDRDSLPKGNLLFVVIARISARAFPIRPLFEAGTKALACEISQRPRANTLSVTLRPSPREKDTFSREKLLSNAITICYGAVTAKRLNDDRHRCAYMLRTRACMCVYASLMRGEERKIERRKESGRSIDIDQLAGIGPRMRELIKPNH